MLKFDLTKIRVEKVYLSKVTGDFVYVRRNLDDSNYEAANGVRTSHLGRPAVKVPFSGGFSAEFMRRNFIREFSRAKRACLVWYGDTLINVELERGRKPDSEGPWISHIEASLNTLPSLLPEGRDIHYDGQYIFWFDEQDNAGEARIDPRGRFAIAPVQSIAVADMGVRRIQSGRSRKRAASDDQRIADQQAQLAAQNESAAAENGDAAPQIIQVGPSASIKVLRRSTLLFRPFAGTDRHDALIAISPVLERRTMESTGRVRDENSRFDDRRALYRLGDTGAPVMGSLEFVMKAADVIGTNYGHEAVDFLDLPKIIAATGEVNLHRIDPEDRVNMPIQHRGEDCIAWLMGFVYREDDLMRQRRLTSMFRYVLRNGLVEQVDMEKLRKPEHANTEIPLRTFRGGDRLATPAPF